MIYFAVWMTAPKTSKDAKSLKEKDDKIADLQNMLKHLVSIMLYLYENIYQSSLNL